MHVSVMPEESLDFWVKKGSDGKISPGIYVDATFGEGGHSHLFLKRTAETENVFLIGLDRDEKRIENGEKKFRESIERKRMILRKTDFRHLKKVISSFKNKKKLPLRGILFDLGVCTAHFFENRGFSFREKNAPLDMRLDKNEDLTAKEILNQWSEQDLAYIFINKGDERFGRKIAREILLLRKRGFSFEKVADLTELIEGKIKQRIGKIHPATKIFQALRIAVNREDESLEKALIGATEILDRGGRLVTIAFHSGEDRAIKHFLRRESKDCICPPEFPICRCDHRKTLKIITRKPILPGEKEISFNPNCRSAKMRVAEKL